MHPVGKILRAWRSVRDGAGLGYAADEVVSAGFRVLHLRPPAHVRGAARTNGACRLACGQRPSLAK